MSPKVVWFKGQYKTTLPLMQHTPRDPFELDRLAEELVTRESTHAESNKQHHSDGQNINHDLPVYVPLSHTNPYLSSDIFNVEEFLLSRLHMSLPDLRSELRDYLSTLKEELVKLLNDDYEAFISLSTDLKGEGARLDRLKLPLGSLRVQIVESQNELQVIQDAIQDKLEKRAILRDEKALLHLLLKISESVTRLESLLLISSPEEGGGSQRLDNVKLPSYLSTADDDNIEDRTRANRAKHLGRVAAEYTQLLYHASKARAAKCVFVDEIQWRIHRIQSTLSSDLDHIFGAILLALTDGKGGKTTESEKTKWMADLTECLRTYDVLGLWRDAEDILRRQLVVGFVKKTIFPGALVAPHSPIVPHTPFPGRSNNPPRTPYTPYTAFASKQNPFNLTYDKSLSVSHFLDDTDDSLARLYNQLLRFVERDLSRIMDIAEKVSVKPVLRVRAEKGIGGGMLPITKDKEIAGNESFEIMANVVWAEIGQAIMDELGGIVFSAGRPNDFRKHHETTQAFIRSLEFLAPSLCSIQAMRSHPVYKAFDRRWQLPVYFQMRWKEIVTKLEDALSVTRIEPVPGKEKHAFVTPQAGAVWIGIITCWSGEVYIPELGHRFWKFTLQLLSRYKTWLDISLPTLDISPKAVASLGIDKVTPGSPASLNHVSTPIPSSDTSLAETNAADDALLKQCAAAIVDIDAMRFHVLALWREEISMMVPRPVDDDGNDVNPEDILRRTLSSLTSLTPPLSNQIVTILTRRSCDALLPVRSIPSQFRAMSHKRVPTEPSYFVPSILRPLKVFFAINTGEGFGAPMKEDYLDTYATDIFEIVSQRYMYYLTAMKKTEESLRRLKKGKKSTFSLFGTSNPGRDEEGRDEERIKTQMILDVEAFGMDAKFLGVNVDASDAFEALNDMVHANTVDE